MKDAIRILAAISAGIGAAQAALLVAPGDLVPQTLLLGLTVISVSLAATVAVLRVE